MKRFARERRSARENSGRVCRGMVRPSFPVRKGGGSGRRQIAVWKVRPAGFPEKDFRLARLPPGKNSGKNFRRRFPYGKKFRGSYRPQPARFGTGCGYGKIEIKVSESYCFKTMFLMSSTSLAVFSLSLISSSTLSREYIMVVWSLPPMRLPMEMSGRESISHMR